MILGEVRGNFFQEGDFLLEFPEFTLRLAQPRPFTHTERRLRAGMLTPIRVDPVTKGRLVDPEFFRDLSDRTRCLDRCLHGLFFELRGELPAMLYQPTPFPNDPDLSGVAVRKAGGGSGIHA